MVGTQTTPGICSETVYKGTQQQDHPSPLAAPQNLHTLVNNDSH